LTSSPEIQTSSESQTKLQPGEPEKSASGQQDVLTETSSPEIQTSSESQTKLQPEELEKSASGQQDVLTEKPVQGAGTGPENEPQTPKNTKDTEPEDGGTVKVPVSTEQQAPLINKEFFTFTGRTAVWAEGLKLLKNSPFIGFGFHSDRLILGTHMHNSVMQALFQAGFLGAIPFVAAIIFGWVLLARIVRNLAGLPTAHKHLVIQSGGVFAFFTMRSLPESTGTFFGIDWLILALLLLYLHLVNEKQNSGEAWA
jgi:hypothetical protein